MTRVYDAIFIITGMAGFPTWGRVPQCQTKRYKWDLKRRIQAHIAWQMGAQEDSIHLTAFRCWSARKSGRHCFKGEAGFSYCAAKDEKYYGFEGHVLIHFEGIICGYAFAAANVDEQDVPPEISAGLHGLLIGDTGCIRPSLKQELE